MILTEYDEAMIFLADRFVQHDSHGDNPTPEVIENLAEEHFNSSFEDEALRAVEDWCKG